MLSVVMFFSLSNSNGIIVFVKLLMILISYFGFLQLFKKDYINPDIVLYGYVLGVMASIVTQLELMDISTLGIHNRISIDNLGNFNAYSFLLATCVIIAVFLSSKIKNKNNKVLFLLLQLPLLVVLFLTLSRGGLFALILGFSVYLIMSSRATKIYMFSVLAIVTCLSTYLLLRFDVAEIFLNRYLNSSDGGDFDSGRTLIYLILLENLFSSPLNLLFGFGFGAIDIRIFLESDIISAHSTYLDVFYSCGIIGLFLFIYYLLGVYKGISKIKDKGVKVFCLALFSQCAFCFLFDSYWGATQIGWIFSLFFAYFKAESYKE